jgi:hypothetical protein
VTDRPDLVVDTGRDRAGSLATSRQAGPLEAGAGRAAIVEAGVFKSDAPQDRLSKQPIFWGETETGAEPALLAWGRSLDRKGAS